MRYFKKTAAAFIGAAVLVTTPISSNAMTLKPMTVTSGQSTDVIKVQRRRYKRGGRNFRRDRGFRRHRGFRRNRGAFIGGAIAGAIIGGAIVHSRNRRYRDRRYHAPRRVYRRAPIVRLSAAHKGWCSGHYRSYRAWDNTFQPYHGPRRQCHSPYN